MAAGQGFKTFTTGEVLTAGDVNGYLMQGINVFADATARDAAITAPAEGQFAFTKDNNSLWYYSGSAWVASGATGDIEGVTATSPLTGGGTSGTVTVGIQDASTSQRGSVQLSDSTSTTSSILAATPTAVKSAYDLAAAAIPKTLTTTTGDTIYASSANTPARLGIGTTGQVLTVSGGVPTWATPAAGGAMTLLSTTSMSGSTTTVSSISQSYKSLIIYVRDFYTSTNTSQISMYLNGYNSSASYYGIQWGVRASTNMSFNPMSNNNGFDLTAGFANYLYQGNTDNFMVINIPDYANTTTKKPLSWQLNAPNESATVINACGFGHSVSVNDAAISSISFNTNAGTWANGSILVYGVN
jgi:hypothetical protein